MCPSGRFVTSTRDGRTRLLNPWTAETQVDLAGPGMINIALSHCSVDGNVFAAATEKNQISIWDTRTGRLLAAVNALEAVVRIAISPKGRRLAMLNDQGRLLVYDLSTKSSREICVRSGRRFRNHSLSFSDDETRLAIGGQTAPGGRLAARDLGCCHRAGESTPSRAETLGPMYSSHLGASL